MKFLAENQLFARRGRHFLRWTHRVFLLTGVLALLYVGLTLLYARVYQQAANTTLEEQIKVDDQRPAGLPLPAIKKREVREGDLLGRMEIPRLGVRVAILEGTTSKTLRLGLGHIVATPLPGAEGNIAIAGHRDTWFRDLKQIREKDQIEIVTVSGLSRYQVDWIQIVTPGDTGILDSPAGSSLTLVTCYPFHYIGAAPERFIVHARKR